MSLALKIIQERKVKGLTQEELADKAGLTLRTIQRIEKGESVPRGHTLRLLSQALDKPIEEFSVFTIAASATPNESAGAPIPNEPNDNLSLQLLNLSALVYLVLPFGNLLAPVYLWRKQKHIIKIYETGRLIINFQLLWTLVMCCSLLLATLAQILLAFYTHLAPGPLVLNVFFIVHFTNVPLILYAAVQLKRGKYEVYRFIPKII